MSHFKEYFTYDCISFTIITLLYAFFIKVNVFYSFTVNELLQLFAMTSCVAILMFFTNQYFSKTIFQMIIVNIIDIFIVVFSLGAAFHMINLTVVNIVAVSVMIIISYFVVFGISAILYQADANCINKGIKKFRDRNKEEPHE